MHIHVHGILFQLKTSYFPSPLHYCLYSWALVNFYRSYTLSQNRGQKDTKPDCCGKIWNFLQGSAFLFLWRVLMVSPRVLALVLFATYSVWMAALVVIAHYVIMLIWICCQKTNFINAPEAIKQEKFVISMQFTC